MARLWSRISLRWATKRSERALGGAQAAVVEGGDHRLAGAGGGDDEVAGVAAAALGVEPVEDLLLERVRADVEVEGEGLGAGALLGAEGLVDAVGVDGRVVGLELALVPVLLEGRWNWRSTCGVSTWERRTFHSRPSVRAAADRFDEPTRAVEKPESRWKSQALAWRRVRRVS